MAILRHGIEFVLAHYPSLGRGPDGRAPGWEGDPTAPCPDPHASPLDKAESPLMTSQGLAALRPTQLEPKESANMYPTLAVCSVRLYII